MEKIPKNYVLWKSMPFFSKENVPDALLSAHQTDAGVYGRICVMSGRLKYVGFTGEHTTASDKEIILKAGEFGISPPQYWHKVEFLDEGTYFGLDFFIDPSEASKK